MASSVRRVPRQRRSREMVDTLLEAAAQMFTREGLAATTNRIAERAGVSIGTLYQYFPDKHALLRMLAERHLTAAAARVDTVLNDMRMRRPPFEETIRAIVGVAVELHRDRPALHVLLHRVAPRKPTDWATLQEFEDHLVEEITFHLDRCGRGGPDTTVTARILVHTLDAQVHRVLPRHDLTSDRLVELMLRLAPQE